jgi:hypothetical protein
MGLQAKNVDPSSWRRKGRNEGGARMKVTFHVRSVEGKKVDDYLRGGMANKAELSTKTREGDGKIRRG